MKLKFCLFSVIVSGIFILSGTPCFKNALANNGPICHKFFGTEDIKENIYGSAVITETDYLIVGSRGKIFRSEDSGKNWREISSGTRNTLYSVSFSDPNNGWISGQSGMILHTTNGGCSWTKQHSGTQKHLFGISFGSALHGCAVGDWSIVLVTDDGGDTWKDTSIEEDVLLYDIHMTDAENGCAVGEFGRIYLTADGGHKWTEIPSPNPEERSLFCVDRDRDSLYAGGLDGLILYSKNGGKTWTQAKSTVNKSIYGMAITGRVGWAVGDAGTVLQTEDAGETWHALCVPERYKLFWLKAVEVNNNRADNHHGFATGASGLYLTLQQPPIKSSTATD